MKAYLREYRLITKAGLLHTSHRVMIGTAIFMFLLGKYLSVELEILIFVLTAIGYMLDFDENKYVISYSMPISIKRRLHMMYYVTIMGSFISVMMVNIRCYLDGNSRSMSLSLVIFMINIIGCNLYYYLFCSQEFKKDILDEDKKQLIYQCLIGGLIGIGIAGKLKWGMQSKIEELLMSLGKFELAFLIGVLSVFTIWWTRRSMQTLERIVRGGS